MVTKRQSRAGRKRKSPLVYISRDGWVRKWTEVVNGKRVRRQKQYGHDEAEAYEKWRVEMGDQLTEIAAPSMGDAARNAAQFFDARHRLDAATIALQGAQTDDDVDDIKDCLQAGIDALRPARRKAKQSGATLDEVVQIHINHLRAEGRSRDHILDAISVLTVPDQKRKRQQRAAKTFLEYFGHATPAASLTRKQFQDYRTYMNGMVTSGKLSQGSVNKVFRHITTAFNTAAREAGVPVPADENGNELPKLLRTKKAVAKELVPFETKDWKLITKDADPFWNAVCYLALNAALSNTDVATIRWGMIKKDYMDFPRGKQKGIRRTPLWASTVKAVKAWKQQSRWTKDEDMVFPDPATGKCFITFTERTKNDRLSRLFGQRMRELGSPHTFKIWRKAGPTACAIHGIPHGHVEMLLGDAADAIWKRYAVAVPPILKNAVAAIKKEYKVK